jgi:hypothetical protein
VPAQINSLNTDDAQVALIIAAHNAAIEYMKAAANGDAPNQYAESFDRIYSQLAAAVDLRGDEDEEDDEFDDDDDRDDDDDDDDDQDDDDDDI